MSYFLIEHLNLKKYDNLQKKHFNIGDVLGLSFRSKGSSYFFEGICIALRKRSISNPETTFILRNVLGSIGIELSVSYFYNKVFFMRLNNFKRKKLVYKRSKLYYVRHKLNKASRVI